MSRLASLLIVPALLCACYRTHYVNFSPRNPAVLAADAEEEPAYGAWRHFFIWGWVPGERAIDARETCGGAQHIASIQTQRKFLQGLIAAFAGYYVNVYSPWDGAVYCTRGSASQAHASSDAGGPGEAGAN
jgi:hypothetical protein